jgi:hypothetical protein
MNIADNPVLVWWLATGLIVLAFWACWYSGRKRKQAQERAAAERRIREAREHSWTRWATSAKKTHAPTSPTNRRELAPSNRREIAPTRRRETAASHDDTPAVLIVNSEPSAPVEKHGGDWPFRSGGGGDFGGGGATGSWDDDNSRRASGLSFASLVAADSAPPPAPAPSYEDCRASTYSPSPSPAYEPPPPPPPAPSPSYESYSSPSPSPSYDSGSSSSSYDSGSSSSSSSFD